MRKLLALTLCSQLSAEIEQTIIPALDDSNSIDIATSHSLSWESHYYSEGRDLLDGDDLISFTTEIAYRNFVAGLWYAESSGSSYNELNLSIQYQWEIWGFETFFAYTGLIFPDDDTFDHELGVGISSPELPGGFVASLVVDHSLRVDGNYFTLSLARDVSLSEKFSVTPSVSISFNNDFVPDGHSGADHVLFRVDAAYEIADNWQLGGYVAFSKEIASDPIANSEDELLQDFFFAGVNLSFSFP